METTMKTWLIGVLMVAVAATMAPPDAQAKRLGAGKPAGMQRDMPARTAPDAPAAKPAQAAPQQAAPATPAVQPGAAAAAPKRNWMGPLAGLAAGLGLAALFSHFGMGEGMGNFLMMALLAGGAIFLVMFLVRRFAGGTASRGLATAGAGASGGGGNAGGAQVAWPQTAAPLERRVEPAALPMQSHPSNPAQAMAPVATADPIARVFVPASFDTEGFTRTAKQIFIRLQAAHDTADLDDLRRFTTPELFASIRLDIQERGNVAQQTDVVKVEAEVLDVAQEAERQIVSVRFHGEVVEEKGAAPTHFNEVWHLVKPSDDSKPWSIAGIEPVA
jgi:predicted lipid-binding transport protein (Tim44 family)